MEEDIRIIKLKSEININIQKPKFKYISRSEAFLGILYPHDLSESMYITNFLIFLVLNSFFFAIYQKY